MTGRVVLASATVSFLASLVAVPVLSPRHVLFLRRTPSHLSHRPEVEP